MSEDQLQQACFTHTWNNHPETRRCIFHVPNGGSRHIVEAKRLKALGVVAGVPDIIFVWNGHIHAFEFKTPTGAVSPAQRQLHSTWQDQGIPVTIIRTQHDWTTAIDQILSYARNYDNIDVKERQI